MKKIIISLFSIVLVSSCTKDISKLNVDPKSPSTEPSRAFFTNAVHTFSNTVTSAYITSNIFRLIEQYWQPTTAIESNYGLSRGNISQELWTSLYKDVITDYREAKKLIPHDVFDPITQKNQIAITDIMEVYTWYYLVTTFGNVPYSEAFNDNNLFPKYDDAATIFDDLLKRMDADIEALDVSGESFGSADPFYAGDVTSWKKFANSLKLKMGMTIADVNSAEAKTVVESAVASGVFTSNDDNALFPYLDAEPNTNPVWAYLVNTGRKDFVACSSIVDVMNPTSDPRLPYYFTVDAVGNYSGGMPGTISNYATYSKPSGEGLVPGSIGHVTDIDFPADILDYSEVEFFLAEAIERGYNVSGTAAAHYNAAITASITYWGGTTADAAAYLALPSVTYTTAAGDFKQKIGFQKWIALYDRGWEAWIETRRLNYPVLVTPPEAMTDFPLRLVYPVNEQTLNGANYKAASAAIGGDLLTTKLFFDK